MQKLRLLLRNPQYFRAGLIDKLRNCQLGKADYLLGSGRSFRPTRIRLQLTDRCNLKCSMCSRTNKEILDPTIFQKKTDMSPKIIRILVDQCQKFRPAFYITAEGEPLLNPFCMEYLNLLKRSGFYVNLQTNGTLIESVAQELIESGIDKITVSVDGPPEVHDQIRGVNGSFAKIERGILLLNGLKKTRRHSPHIQINCVINKQNICGVDKTVAIAESLGANSINFQHLMFDFESDNRRQNEAYAESFGEIPVTESTYPSEIGPKDISLLLNQLRAVPDRPDFEVSVSPRLADNLVEHYYLDKDFPFRQECLDPWQSLNVAPDGQIMVCFGYKVGDVCEKPISELWNNSRMVRFRSRIKRHLFPKCIRCCARKYSIQKAIHLR